MASVSLNEEQCFTQLRAFILGLLPGVEVVRGLDNRVPMPRGPFVLITGTGLVPLAVPTVTYGGMLETQAVGTPLQWSIGVDCFGPLAQDWAVILSTVLRTPYTCEQMADVQPLYASDVTQFPLVDGEQQYEERWRFDAVMEYTPVVSLAQQSARSLVLDLVSVDAKYPPGA